jgi:hypothetical protein
MTFHIADQNPRFHLIHFRQMEAKNYPFSTQKKDVIINFFGCNEMQIIWQFFSP